jgi:hypothetical protein
MTKEIVNDLRIEIGKDDLSVLNLGDEIVLAEPSVRRMIISEVNASEKVLIVEIKDLLTGSTITAPVAAGTNLLIHRTTQD